MGKRQKKLTKINFVRIFIVLPFAPYGTGLSIKNFVFSILLNCQHLFDKVQECDARNVEKG